MENMKELFREMFKEEEEQALIKIFSSFTSTLNQRLDKLTLQVRDNNNKLREICNETNYLRRAK